MLTSTRASVASKRRISSGVEALEQNPTLFSPSLDWQGSNLDASYETLPSQRESF